MGFDREGALKAGYTPEEIDAFVASDTYSPNDIKGLNVPQWGQNNPNLYAGVMTALDTIPAAASLAGKAKVGIPVAAALSAAAGATKRAIDGEKTGIADVVNDAAYGAGVEGAGRGLGKIISKMPDAADYLLGKALKLSNSPNILSPEERVNALKTYWKYGLEASENGWNKLKSIIDSARTTRDSALAAGDASGIMLDPLDAMTKGDIPGLLKLGAEREGSYPGYNKAVEEISLPLLNKGKRTPTAMNQEKMQLQAMLDDASAFGSNTKSLPSTEARKRWAAGIVKDIADNVPGVAEPNATMSELLNFAPHLARSTGRMANHDLIGLKDTVMLQDAVTGEKGIVPFLMALAAKGRTTERLAKGAKGIGNIAGKTSPMTKQAFRTGLESAIYGLNGGNNGQ